MIKRLFRQMLLTQILSALTVMICMFVDSIMIGRFLGSDAMTAYGLTNPILLIFAALGSMLTAGIQVQCGKTMGRGDREGTDTCYSAAITLAAGVGFLGFFLIILFASPICTALGAGVPGPEKTVFTLTKDYLTGIIVCAPAFLLAQTMVPFLQMSGKGVRLAAAVGVMTISDIIFDLLNVFVFKGGTFGMGLASSLSYYIALVIGGSYFLTKKCMFRMKLRSVRFSMFRELLKHGVPTMLNQAATVLLVYLMNQILLSVGHNTAVAAYSVINTIANICYCFGAGIGSVALMLSSMFYSDKDLESLYSIVRTMLFYCIVLNAAVTAVTLIAAPQMVGMFLTDNPSAVSMAAAGTRLFSLSLPFCSLNTSFKNFYQGTGKTHLTNIISPTQSLFSKIAVAFVMSRLMGTEGVWFSWLLGEILTLLIVSCIVWKRNRKCSISVKDYALLSEEAGAQDSDRIDINVRSIEEVIEASGHAAEVCRSKGMDPRTSMLIARCIEEMAANIVKHGFTKDHIKNHVINIRIMFKDNEGLIRLRDNCVNFDPVSYMDLHKSDDPTSHIGIRMIMNMVKDANYVSSLGLNNLTLTI